MLWGDVCAFDNVTLVCENTSNEEEKLGWLHRICTTDWTENGGDYYSRRYPGWPCANRG